MWAEIAIGIASFAVLAEPGPIDPVAAPAPGSRVEWRPSAPLGLPEAGRLVDGVRLPAEGGTYFTWDPVLKRRPDRDWRRWGTTTWSGPRSGLCMTYGAVTPTRRGWGSAT